MFITVMTGYCKQMSHIHVFHKMI